MRCSFIFATALAMALAFPVWAESASPTLDEIRTQQIELRDAARAGQGVFEDYSRSDRAGLVAKQDAVLAMIEGKQTADQLDEPVRMEVFNRLEEIRMLVEKAEDSRVVCDYEKRVGSNMKTRVCKTVAERRVEREQAVDIMNKRSICADCKGF